MSQKPMPPMQEPPMQDHSTPPLAASPFASLLGLGAPASGDNSVPSKGGALTGTAGESSAATSQPKTDSMPFTQAMAGFGPLSKTGFLGLPGRAHQTAKNLATKASVTLNRALHRTPPVATKPTVPSIASATRAPAQRGALSSAARNPAGPNQVTRATSPRVALSADAEEEVRAAERWRCAQIIAHGMNINAVHQASAFAFDSEMSAEEAIAVLNASVSADAARPYHRAADKVMSFPEMTNGVATGKHFEVRVSTKGAPQIESARLAASIVAAAKKARGEA